MPFQPLSHSDIIGILVVLIDLSLLVSNGQLDARWYLFTDCQAECYHNLKSDFITTSAHISNAHEGFFSHHTRLKQYDNPLFSVFIQQSLHKDLFCSGFVFYLTTGHSSHIPLVRYDWFKVLGYYYSIFSSL